jgi:hypothetical protein
MKLAAQFARNSNRILSDQALTNEQIRTVAPSIFAASPHDSRSARYTYIPTIDVLNGLRKEGFQPFFVCQSKCRIEGKGDFTKHMIRLRRDLGKDGETGETILINSHDGTSSYQLLAGWFRFVCQNGCITGTQYSDVRVRHQGDIVNDVIDAAYTVVDSLKTVEDSRNHMAEIPLRFDEQEAYARSAALLKYEEHMPIRPAQLLAPRRHEDQGNDLWTTFQRVQENMIRGGLHGRTATGRRSTTRGITGIDQDVRLNRGLWTLTEEMKKIKLAA